MIKKIALSAALLASAGSLTLAALAEGGGFDAARLKTGHFTYHDTQGGKTTESSVSIVRTDQDLYRFAADFPAFEQSWSTVATPVMGPVETTLKMRTRDGRHYEMHLSYKGRHVTGQAVTNASADGKQAASSRTVEGDIPERTVDQRIDWATVMTVDAKPGDKFSFKVYDASTGISRVDCAVSDAGTLSVPAGKFDALRLDYTVYKASGTESYTVYATRSLPRLMLREDLPGALVSELVKAEP